ncbi:aspartyl-phosphate phosphatase Spo0E family protein [Bacillus sp. J37]|uniref:aspartyl-phosphate phosphatase Spo0E family protein n=1 Tax=Bacillus sp. J37 TaxID=935837 RepID=UPI000A0608C5
MIKSICSTSPTRCINVLKSQLIEFGLYLGLNHPITVSLSQNLDEKLTEFQKIDFMEI